MLLADHRTSAAETDADTVLPVLARALPGAGRVHRGAARCSCGHAAAQGCSAGLQRKGCAAGAGYRLCVGFGETPGLGAAGQRRHRRPGGSGVGGRALWWENWGWEWKRQLPLDHQLVGTCGRALFPHNVRSWASVQIELVKILFDFSLSRQRKILLTGEAIKREAFSVENVDIVVTALQHLSGTWIPEPRAGPSRSQRGFGVWDPHRAGQNRGPGGSPTHPGPPGDVSLCL